MPTPKTASPYEDQDGNPIHEGDLCRSWVIDKVNEPAGGAWLFEIVKFYQNGWYLFEVNFDYSKSDEKPVLLKDYNRRIEVVTIINKDGLTIE